MCNVGHQLQHLRHLLEKKRMAVGEAIESWQKFLHMHAAVSQWFRDKGVLLGESLAAFATIGETKQKLQVGMFFTWTLNAPSAPTLGSKFCLSDCFVL